jgi:hypothetical protein
MASPCLARKMKKPRCLKFFLAKQRVDTGNRSFIFVVDSPSVSVGIDPLNKLIDRKPDDRMKNVDVLN